MKTSFLVRAFLMGVLTSKIVGLAPAMAAPAKAAQPKAPIYSISLSNSGHGHGPYTDGGYSWVLHANGTAERDGDKGKFSPSEFDHLVQYLQSSKLLDQKSPPETEQATDITGETTLSLIRGSKKKSLVVSDLAEDPEDFWVMKSLINSIFAHIDWKNDKGLSVNTGMKGFFDFSDINISENQSAIMGALFDVKNDKGKVVETISLENQEGSYQMLLPPGIYTVSLPPKGRSYPNGTHSPPVPANLVWHALPGESFEVIAGQITTVNIKWETKPATP